MNAGFLLLVSVLLACIDAPYLWYNSGMFASTFQKIQGSPLKFRYEAAFVIYPAIAFLLSYARSVSEAFLIGVTTYAVYDFTNYSSLTNYPLSFALQDTAWGGILLSLGYLIKEKFMK